MVTGRLTFKCGSVYTCRSNSQKDLEASQAEALAQDCPRCMIRKGTITRAVLAMLSEDELADIYLDAFIEGEAMLAAMSQLSSSRIN